MTTHFSPSSSPELLQSIIALRIRAWRNDPIFTTFSNEKIAELVTDDLDADAIHFVAFHHGVPIGAARIVLINTSNAHLLPYGSFNKVLVAEFGTQFAYLGRLVVDPAWRNQSIAAQLLAQRLDFMQAAHPLLPSITMLRATATKHYITKQFRLSGVFPRSLFPGLPFDPTAVLVHLPV